MSTSLHLAALDYVAKCWPIFPVEPRGKRPATPHGFHDACSDPARVSAWWDEMPTANIGISCGLGALVTIDIDGELGEESWRAFLDGRDLEVPQIQTGRGRQLAFEGEHIPRRIGFLPGVDICGNGGYSILPPSVHPTGAMYTWTSDDEIVPMPSWLHDELAAPRVHVYSTEHVLPQRYTNAGVSDQYARAALDGELARVLGASIGTRNNALCVAAFNLGQLVGAGVLDAGCVIGALYDAALAAGLGARESELTIASGLDAGHATPRRW